MMDILEYDVVCNYVTRQVRDCIDNANGKAARMSRSEQMCDPHRKRKMAL